MTTDLDQRLRALDPVADVQPDDAAADALLTHVLASPPDVASRRPLLAVAACVAAAAAVVVAVTVVNGDSGPALPTAAPTATQIDVELVHFTKKRNGAVVARITDPYAGAEQLTAAFKAHGLDIHVSALAASPSAVGTVVFSDFDAKAIRVRGCETDGGGACQVGFVVPADFTGHGEAAVGRPAHPAEVYQTGNDSFTAKEALHCSGIVGKRATDPSVAEVLAERGLTAEWSVRVDLGRDVESGLRMGESHRVKTPPDGYVRGATPISATTVLISTGDTPPQDIVDRAERGC